MAFLRTFLSDAAPGIFRIALASLVVLMGLIGPNTWAQGPATTSITATTTNARTLAPSRLSKKTDGKPAWNELTPAQQQALAPLANEWNKMEPARREKWLAISAKYAAMSAPEQARLQERMRDWIKLTPVQRRAVRENYTRAKKLDAEKKSAQWKQYQQLSDEQKKKLAQIKLPKQVARPPVMRGKPPGIELPIQAQRQPLKPVPSAVPPATLPTEAK